MSWLQLSNRTNKLFPIIFFFLLILWSALNSEVIINSIEFTGNQLLSDELLREKITSRSGELYQPAAINKDIQIISDLYAENNFYNFDISAPELNFLANQKVEINFIIKEYENLLLDSLIISGQNYLSSDKMQEYITISNLTLSDLPAKIREIIRYYNDSGFMLAAAELDSIAYLDNKYYGFLSITEGKYSNVTEYLFRGNQHSTGRSLLKISQLEKYDFINPTVLRQAEDRILSRPYIKQCRIYLLDHERLLIEIKEDRMTYFSGILGYNNASNNNSSFNGFLDVQLLNLFGTDRTLGLAWQRTTSDRNSVDLNYHESGPFQIPLSADFSLQREEVDSTYISSVLTSEIYYYTLYNKYGISFSYNSIFPGSRRPKLVTRNDQTKVGLFWQFSNVFSPNPQKGNKFKIAYYNIFYNTAQDNDSRYQTEMFSNTYLNLFRKYVLAFSLNARALENKDLQTYELFSLGGKDDLRGYAEDQFQGDIILWSNLEFRYLLSYDSRFFVFFDYGYVQQFETRTGKLFSLGIGLRISTRLGLLGFDYGIGYENDKFRNPLDGIIHFGLETKL